MVVSVLMPSGKGNQIPQHSKQDLTLCRRELLELMQSVNFGRLEMLLIRDGQPVLNPRPKVIREIKFCAENGPREELNAANFCLKAQVVEFFAFLDEFQNGTIGVLEVKHGLPFRMVIVENDA